MKKEYYDEDAGAWVRKAIDREEAVWRLSCFYDNPEQLAETIGFLSDILGWCGSKRITTNDADLTGDTGKGEKEK